MDIRIVTFCRSGCTDVLGVTTPWHSLTLGGETWQNFTCVTHANVYLYQGGMMSKKPYVKPKLQKLGLLRLITKLSF
jgi:hypothetical protein